MVATIKNPKVYPPAGRCIYCPSTEGLSKEHIIALSLNGAMILPDASCRDCAQITGEIECICARTIFGPFRRRHNFRSRRRNKRPTHIAIESSGPDGQATSRLVPASEIPDVLFLLKFRHTATLLLGDPDIDTSAVEPWIRLGDGAKPQVGDTAARFDAFSFARMLAKIGHSFAVAELGVSSFAPLALDFILNRSDNLSRLVGGSPEEKSTSAILHRLRLRDHLDLTSRRHFIVAHICLFAILGAPTYHVVVGEMPWGSKLIKK